MKFKISPIALGTMQFLWTTTEQEAYAILDAYVSVGGNCIDTADMYPNWLNGYRGGEVECIIGNWMKKRNNRKNIFLITKVRAKTWEGKDGEGLSRRHIIVACEKSLQRLQTDYIDVYMSHWSDPETSIAETLSAYQVLIRQGKIFQIGCSNYSKNELQEALQIGKELGTTYTFLEAYYNLIDRENFEDNLLSLVKKYKLKVFPYSPLASGFLTGIYRKEKPLPRNVRAKFVKVKMTKRNLLTVDHLDNIAKKYGKTISQIALAWLMQKTYITAPIIGVDSVKQLKENLGAINISLIPEDLQKLDMLVSKT